MKLKNHPYANCSVRFSDGWVILKSYETDTGKSKNSNSV